MKIKKTDQETMEDISASNSPNFFMIYYPNIWSTFVLRDSGRKSLRLFSENGSAKSFREGEVSWSEKIPAHLQG